MKKTILKRSVLFVITLIMIGMLYSCDNTNTTVESDVCNNGRGTTTYGSFISIPGQESNGLFYHKQSKTVYIVFDYWVGTRSGVFSVTPYIDEGHYWEYVDGKIVPDKADSTSYEATSEPTSDEVWESLTEEEKKELLKSRE